MVPTGWQRVRARIRGGLAGVGLLAVAGLALGTAAARRRAQAAAALPDQFVLEVDLEITRLAEHVGPKGLQALFRQGGALPLARVVEALRAAGEDERVVGLLALLGGPGGSMGLAQVQELRDAVSHFRQHAAGRAAAVAYSDAFGEAGTGGTSVFYLASAFDLILMQPTGTLSVTGLAATSTFARGLLDRWKVQPVFFAREEYKSAASFILNKSSSRAEREALTSTLRSLSGQVVRGIAAGRGLTETQVKAAIDTAPHLAWEAQALGLIDAQLYRDQALKLVARLHEAASSSPPGARALAAAAVASGARWQTPELLQRLLREPDAAPSKPLKHVSVARYAAALEQQRKEREAEQRREHGLARLRQLLGMPAALVGQLRAQLGLEEGGGAEPAAAVQQGQEHGQQGAAAQPTIALLTLTGPIYLGNGPSAGLGPAAARQPGHRIASLPVIASLRAARQNPAVRAVVLRIDSPGGSAAGSDAIHREVALLRQAGKPVVVSMGNAAASGGYYISCAADKIVAQPGTITGSIGVLAGKLVVGDALRQYGINAETVKEGRNADAMSPFAGFDRQQRAKVDHMIDCTYATFKQRVAEGRGLSEAAVARLAKGRVWTGEQALGLGLVDQLGGLQAAVQLAKQAAGLPLEEGAVRVRQVFPEVKPPLQQVLKLLVKGEAAEDGSSGGGGGAPAAAAAAVTAALSLGLQLSSAEWALLEQVQAGGAISCQCLAPEAERLAAAA